MASLKELLSLFCFPDQKQPKAISQKSQTSSEYLKSPIMAQDHQCTIKRKILNYEIENNAIVLLINYNHSVAHKTFKQVEMQ